MLIYRQNKSVQDQLKGQLLLKRELQDNKELKISMDSHQSI